MRNVSQHSRRRLSVLDRYIFKEFSLNLLAVITVLWLIYISTRFARYLAKAATGEMPPEVILELLGYTSLGAVSILLPIACFLAVLLSLGRMNSDNELTVMSACGVSTNKILSKVVFFSGLMAIIVSILTLWVVPEVLSKRNEIEQSAKLSANTSGLLAGSFKESQNGDWTFYSEGLSDDKQFMENVFIEIKGKQKPLIFRAESGYFDIDVETGDKYLILEQGYRYEGFAGQQDFTIAEYATHTLLIEKGGKREIRERHKAMSTKKLLALGTAKDIAEVQWRISSALMTVLLSVVAVPLANAGPRKGRYAGFVPAVLIYIVYSNLLGVSKAAVAKEQIPVLAGAITAHIVMIIIILILFNRQKLTRRFGLARFKFRHS